MIKSVLIPVNDSQLIGVMLKKVVNIIDLSNATIILVHISNPIPPAIFYDDSLLGSLISNKEHRQHCNKFAIRILAKYQKILMNKYSIELLHLYDVDVADGIIKAAKKTKVDIIAMPSHRYSGIKSILLSNNTQKVILNTKLPVLIL